MAWNIYITESNNEQGEFNQFTVIISILLITFILLIGLYNVHGNITTKISNHSMFTNPPLIPALPIINEVEPTPVRNCNSTSSVIKEAIKCFEDKQFNNAKTIFIRTRKKAISNKNSKLLLEVDMYLAFIFIEQDKIDVAIEKIKHLFFLQADFDIQQYDSNKKKYLSMFKKIREHGRNLKEKEIDDISGVEFIRVTSCSESYCKGRFWQQSKYYQEEASSKIDRDESIDCSMDKTCDKDIDDSIDCSMDKTCDKDIDASIDCSMDKTCDKDIDASIDCSMNGIC